MGAGAGGGGSFTSSLAEELRSFQAPRLLREALRLIDEEDALCRTSVISDVSLARRRS